MENVFVKPAVAGAVVRDPGTLKPLAATGEWKELSPYWASRIRDDDVTLVEDDAVKTTFSQGPQVQADVDE